MSSAPKPKRMTFAPNGSSRPRTLTDAVRARQARRGGRPAAGGSSRVRGARGEETRRGASTAERTVRQGRDGGAQSWLSRLLTPLKWLGQKLLDVFDSLESDRAGQLRKLGALVAAGLLAKRLPGPLRWLSGLLTSGLTGERGFGFWWLVVALGVALAVGALVALLVSPVAGLIALLVVGIWMLVQRARNKDRDEDRSNERDDGGVNASPPHGNAGPEPGLASSPD